MCMIDGADGVCEFSSDVFRTARKEYQCYECRRVISIGERHRYISGKWEGSFDTYRICAHCSVGCDLLSRECQGFLLGGIEEDLREHVSEILPWSMQAARLVVGMRRKWRRFVGDGLMPVPALAQPGEGE